MRVGIAVLLSATILAPLAQAADRYLEEKAVRRSEWFTGTVGNARLEPVSLQAWLDQRGKESGLLDYGFFIEDARLDSLVYGIANRLLAHWPGNVPPIILLVQGDGSPLLYGASTTHANEIVIRYGVLVHAESEDELAAVIAHELAHVLLEHVKTLDYKKTMASALQTFAQVSEIQATAEALRLDRETGKLSMDPSLENDLMRSAQQKMVAEKAYGSVHASLFSRRNEQSADKLALDLLAAAGYSPQGLKMSLERMAHSHDLTTELSGYFETTGKQLLTDTLAAVEQHTDEQGFQREGFDQYLSNSESQLKSSVLEFGKSTFMRFSSRSHPVPAKRVSGFTEYLYEGYGRNVRRRMPEPASAAQFRDGTVGSLVTRYTKANQALIAAAGNDAGTARQLMTEALAAPASSHAYTRYAAFSIERNQGDGRKAMQHARAISAAGFMPLHAAVEVADYLAAAGATTELKALLATQQRRFGEAPGFFPARIVLARAAGNQTEVQGLVQQCFQSAGSDSTLSGNCARYAGVAPPEQAPAVSPAKAVGALRDLFGPKN